MLIMLLSATLWKKLHVEIKLKFHGDKQEKLSSFWCTMPLLLIQINNFCAYGLKHFEYIYCMDCAKPVTGSSCHFGKCMRKINTERQKGEKSK